MKFCNTSKLNLFLSISIAVYFFISCNENKVDIKTKSYKIKGLKTNFLLPERFEIYSKLDVEKNIEIQGSLKDPILKDALINKQAHFVDKANEDYVILIPFNDRVYLDKDFLSPFSYMMKQEISRISQVNFELIDKVFITTKNYNQAFKLKYKYFTLFGDKYATVYMITDKFQSLMIIYHSFYEDDFHNIVAIHMNRN